MYKKIHQDLIIYVRKDMYQQEFPLGSEIGIVHRHNDHKDKDTMEQFDTFLKTE